MSRVEERLAEIGLALPEPMQLPAGVTVAFAWARVFGDRVHISGHGPLLPDGTIAGPFGRVGAEVTEEQAYAAARLATLAILASLKREAGDLDRVAGWLRIEGFVLAAPGFTRTTAVLDGCSDLLIELFGRDIGRHARSAMGVAATPLSCPVVIAAEAALRPPRQRAATRRMP